MFDNQENNPFTCNSFNDKITIILRYLVTNDIGLSILLISISYGNLNFNN
jgi:hypothetical protein